MPAPDPATLWATLRPDDRGLVTAIVQDVHSGRILMVAWMNQDALAATIRTGHATFWSRSRGRLWEKGEESGNTMVVEGIRVDCDGDVLLLRSRPLGPACHTGRPSCFFREVDGDTLAEDDGPPAAASTVLAHVFDVILERKAGRGATNAEGRSYVRSLLDGGAPKIGDKIGEEAQELVRAIASETDERVSAEAADLIFHVLVGLAQRGLHLDDVAEVLRARFGRSGIDEKSSRRG